MENALLLTGSHARDKQLRYTNQYNKREKHTKCVTGEKVIGLYPTLTNKIISRFHGTCTQYSPTSATSAIKVFLLVHMGNDYRKITHYNKIRLWAEVPLKNEVRANETCWTHWYKDRFSEKPGLCVQQKIVLKTEFREKELFMASRIPFIYRTAVER